MERRHFLLLLFFFRTSVIFFLFYIAGHVMNTLGAFDGIPAVYVQYIGKSSLSQGQGFSTILDRDS